MSGTIKSIQNDHKDVEEGNLSEQASLDTSLHMYVVEDEEKNVCRSVLHKKEEHSTRRDKLDASKENERNKDRGVFGQNREYIVAYEYGADEPIDYRYTFIDELPEERNAFVRKVMTILFVMLSITGGFMFSVAYVESLNDFFRRYFMWIMIPSLIGVVIMGIVMPFTECARTFPTNYVCLVIATIVESLFLASITARYHPQLLVMAFGATALVVVVCFLLALTRFDFTRWYLMIVACSSALGFLTVIVLLLQYVFNIQLRIAIIVILFCLTITNVVMLISELQMILGGKTIALTVYDYALGAFMLYMTIITIFLNILQMMQQAQSSQ